MVKFITKGYKPRKKTKTQVENKFARVSALCYILLSIWRIKRRTKRRGAFKCKREGYALFKASYVQDVKYNFSSHSEFCFFETKVKASMIRDKTFT